MLKRNFRLKNAPEKWQNEKNKRYDIVLTYEERVFNSLLNGELKENFCILLFKLFFRHEKQKQRFGTFARFKHDSYR